MKREALEEKTSRTRTIRERFALKGQELTGVSLIISPPQNEDCGIDYSLSTLVGSLRSSQEPGEYPGYDP